MRILALMLYGLLGMVASVAAAEELPWRKPDEPGKMNISCITTAFDDANS